MIDLVFEKPEDQELLDKVKQHLNDQLDKGIKDLDRRLKDLLTGSVLDEIEANLEYLTISRFNLMITKDYVNSEYAFKNLKLGKEYCEFSVRKQVLQMLLACNTIADRIISTSFSGAFKYEYSRLFMDNPEGYFNNEFFTIIEEVIYDKKGTI